MYFLGDNPQPALVERTAQAFARSHGDIAATLAQLLSDPQAQQYGQRFKDPMHYVLGAVRLAYDQRVASDVGSVQSWINQLGQSLYGYETPNGYPQAQSDWSSSGQMMSRFAVAQQIGARGAVLFRSDPKVPLEKPPYPDLAGRASVGATAGVEPVHTGHAGPGQKSGGLEQLFPGRARDDVPLRRAACKDVNS